MATFIEGGFYVPGGILTDGSQVFQCVRASATGSVLFQASSGPVNTPVVFPDDDAGSCQRVEFNSEADSVKTCDFEDNIALAVGDVFIGSTGLTYYAENFIRLFGGAGSYLTLGMLVGGTPTPVCVKVNRKVGYNILLDRNVLQSVPIAVPNN